MVQPSGAIRNSVQLKSALPVLATRLTNVKFSEICAATSPDSSSKVDVKIVGNNDLRRIDCKYCDGRSTRSV